MSTVNTRRRIAAHRAPLAALALITICSLAAVTTLAQSRPDVRWQAGGHAAGVTHVAFSPDGQFVASSSGDGTAKVWSALDGRLRFTFTIPNQANTTVHSVQFSPDSAAVVFTGTGGGYLVRISDGVMLREFCCIETGYATAFSPDGQYIAVGGSETGLEETTLLFRLSDGALIRKFTKDVQHYVFAVQFTPDGSQLITGSGSIFLGGTLGVIRYWRISDGVETRTINAHNSRIVALDLSPDGAVLASASSDGTAKLWDRASGAFVRSLTGHTGAVNSVEFSPGGERIVTAGSDGTLRIWDTVSGGTIRTIAAHSGAAATASWSLDGSRLLSGGGQFGGGSGDATVARWIAESGAPELQLTQHTKTLESVAASNSGALIATGGYEGVIALRSALTGDSVRTINNGALVTALAFTPDDSVIVAGGGDKNVRLYSVATGALLRTLTGHSATVEGLACSPDGVYVVAGDWDGPAKVWSIADGAFVADFNAGNIGARSLAFSPDGQKLVVAGGNAAQIRSFPAGTVLHGLPGHTYAVLSVAFSPLGDEVATGSIDRTIRLWNPTNGALVRTLSGHENWVESVAYTRDGRLLVSGSQSYDRTLRVWNPHTGVNQKVYDLEIGSGVYGVATLPERGIAYVRRDGTSVVIEPPAPATFGDWNYDAAVNLPDLLALPPCVSGPAADADWDAPSANCVDVYDADADADIDLADIAALQEAFGH